VAVLDRLPWTNHAKEETMSKNIEWYYFRNG